jgi:hypothetical protein
MHTQHILICHWLGSFRLLVRCYDLCIPSVELLGIEREAQSRRDSGVLWSDWLSREQLARIIHEL